MTFQNVREFAGHSAAVYSLAYDQHFLYSASADKFVTRWNLQSGEQDKFALKFDSSPYVVKSICDGAFVIAGLASGLCYIISLQDRSVVKEFDLQAAIFSITENPLLSQFYIGDVNGVLTVFDSLNFTKLLAIPLNCGKIRRIAVSADGKKIAVASQDGRIRIIETSFYNEVSNFPAHDQGTTALCFDLNNSEILYSGGKDAILRKWNNLDLLLEVPAHNYVIYEILQFSENILVTASRDKTIKTFSTTNLEFHQRLDSKVKGHRHSVNCLVKIDDSTFASCGDDKRIIIWKAVS